MCSASYCQGAQHRKRWIAAYPSCAESLRQKVKFYGVCSCMVSDVVLSTPSLLGDHVTRVPQVSTGAS